MIRGVNHRAGFPGLWLRRGHSDLEALHGVAWPELLELHGVGKRAPERLQVALLERSLSMAGVPESEARETVFTLGRTGADAADIRTHATGQSPAQYVEELDTPRRVEHDRQLLHLREQTGGHRPGGARRDDPGGLDRGDRVVLNPG